MIPGVPAAQLALIEPDLNPGSPERLADSLSRLGILRGVAQEYGVRPLSHDGTTPETHERKSSQRLLGMSLS